MIERNIIMTDGERTIKEINGGISNQLSTLTSFNTFPKPFK